MKKVMTTLLLAAFAMAFGSCNKDKDEPEEIVALNLPIEYAVDLGLESGTKWAKMNVGAENPWDFGNYYAWGEITTKSYYAHETYKYYNLLTGKHDNILTKVTKYCNDADFGKDGITDDYTTLLPEDDAATANWGNTWATPTLEEWIELYEQCYWVWTDNYNSTGKSGSIVYMAKQEEDKGQKVYGEKKTLDSYSLSDVHIFLPASGGRILSESSGTERSGYYWTSSLNTYNCPGAHFLGITSLPYDGVWLRFYGFSVRPIWRNK